MVRTKNIIVLLTIVCLSFLLANASGGLVEKKQMPKSNLVSAKTIDKVDAELILEYLRVFLSPQMIAGIVVTLLVLRFEKEIRTFIDKLVKLRLPGGSELSAPTLEKRPDDQKYKQLESKFENLSDKMQTIVTYTEKMLQDNEFNLGSVVVDEQKRLAEAQFWRMLLQNPFVEHLSKDYHLTQTQIMTVLDSENNVNSIAEAVYNLDNDSTKKARIKRLMEQFPKTVTDFERAKAFKSSGG